MKSAPPRKDRLSAPAPQTSQTPIVSGCRHYAAAISSLLDPKGELFGERVIANSGVTGEAESSSAVDLIKRLDARVGLFVELLHLQS